MMKTHLSLRTLLCWSVLICLAPAGLMAQEAKKTEAQNTQEDKKPAAEEKKTEDKKPAAEEKKTDDKKPAAEEKKTDDKKPAAEEKKTDDKKPATEDKKPAAEEAGVETTEMVINLDNPSGLAIHPKTGHVFIASHDGVHRFIPEMKPLKCPLEISEFPTDVYGKGPMYDISALGVAFWDDEHLIVGEGCRKDGEELVRIYKITEKPPTSYQKESDAVYTAGPIPPGDESKMGEGNFYSVVKIGDTVFVSSNGDDTKGWIASFTIKDGKATELKPTIATKEKTQVDAPVPLAASPDGKLVVGQMGEVNVPGDSLLCIYDPASGELEKSLKTGLSDIAGLAYSKNTKKWYCTDFAWAEPENAGLFELTIDGNNVTPKKLAKLDKPTALEFDKDGNLYVTVFGTGKEGDKMTPGKLLMIKADQLK